MCPHLRCHGPLLRLCVVDRGVVGLVWRVRHRLWWHREQLVRHWRVWHPLKNNLAAVLYTTKNVKLLAWNYVDISLSRFQENLLSYMNCPSAWYLTHHLQAKAKLLRSCVQWTFSFPISGYGCETSHCVFEFEHQCCSRFHPWLAQKEAPHAPHKCHQTRGIAHITWLYSGPLHFHHLSNTTFKIAKKVLLSIFVLRFTESKTIITRY